MRINKDIEQLGELLSLPFDLQVKVLHGKKEPLPKELVEALIVIDKFGNLAGIIKKYTEFQKLMNENIILPF